MALTDIKVRSAKPEEKPYKLTDGNGMFLLVHTNGSKYWCLRYRSDGKEKTLALGVYPEVSLSEARQKRDDARKLIAAGVDPVILPFLTEVTSRIRSCVEYAASACS
ncbi:Arm DNA-binding domain-containing protein, partial [Brenneria izbisi]